MGIGENNVISINDFAKEDFTEVLDIAEKMEKNNFPELLKEKIMASLFFEPSTRTRLSFVSAMNQLGGEVIGFNDPDSSSISKGESTQDTVKVVDKYADIIVIRHPLEGAARAAAEVCNSPIINAGDGANQHPTQTLLDMYTIKKVKGTLDGLRIGMVGDLKYGRTVHSLTTAMSHFNPSFTFIAPEELQMPKTYLHSLDQKRIDYDTTNKLEGAGEDLDILYVTRIQKERFADPAEYEKHKGTYQIDKDLLGNAEKNMKIMHPLPRVDEISREVDDTEHAVYFEQAENGIHVRKALLALLLGEEP